MNNKIYQTAVRVNDDVYSVDTIIYEGKIWLVPDWDELPSLKVIRPSKIIRIDLMPYQKPDDLVFDYVLNVQFDKAVHDWKTSEGFEIEVHPEIFYDIPNASNLN